LLSANCVEDHIHLLISLGREQTLAQVVKLIKGESSKWVNDSNLLETYFSWQREYMGISISHTHLDKLKEYIAIQEKHHSEKSTESEFEYFSQKYGFEKSDFS
jgi:putative transposase